MSTYLFSLLLIIVAATPAWTANLEGLIRDAAAATQPVFVVSLTPPSDSSAPKHLTSTSPAGNYALKDISAGRYLFEVRYGEAVIFREVIEVNGQDKKDVTLERR